jgi:tripartite-type tricarboxylate transporter receptor subunit TctC
LTYTGTLAINPTLYSNAGYNPRKDFTPIGSIGTLTSVLVSNPKLPVKSTGELITYAQANPGKINYGFVPGTVGHISTEMFARSANIKLTNIPYKGNGNAIADLMGGHVSMMMLSILPVIGQIQSGTLNALAVASPARSSLIPNVPTIAESGVPGFSAVISYGLSAPAGTPRPIIERLNKELQAALADETLRKRLDAEGGQVVAGTPEDYAAMIDAEEKKWGALVKNLDLKMD